jgi:hypothetical protein
MTMDSTNLIYIGVAIVLVVLSRLKPGKKKPAQAKTATPDEYVCHYQEPPEKLQAILQQVPGTGDLLYQYTERDNITKSAKYWALEMLERGFETPGIIQLAGEDLDMDPMAYSELLDTIFRELDFEVRPEVACCAYAASIAEEVIQGQRTAREGFELLYAAMIHSNYDAVFLDFFYAKDYAEEVVPWPGEGRPPQPELVDEWLYRYFEAFLAANPKYRSTTIATQG